VSEGKIDIVFGGAYSIKEYYEESGNPKQMRGASALLEDMFQNKIPCILENEEYGVSKDHIRSIGSQLFAVLRSGQGEEVVSKIEECFQKTCQTAQFVFVCEKDTATLADLENKSIYPDIKRRLYAKMQEKRYSQILQIAQQDAADDGPWQKNYIRSLDKVGLKKYRDFIDRNKPDKTELCEACRLRPPHYLAEVQGKRERGEPSVLDVLVLCTSCAKKEAEGRTEAEDNPEKIQSFRYPENHHKTDITRMDDLADTNGNVAVLYADINNLGSVTMQTFDEDKRLHEAVAESVQKAVDSTLALLATHQYNSTRQQSGLGNFQKISCAGDDVCILIPGEYALFVATTLASQFDSIWEQHNSTFFDARDTGLFISVGVAIAPSDTSIDYYHDMVSQLLISAKKYFHALPQGDKQSCVDAYIIGGDGQTASKLALLRSAQGYESLFPMTATYSRAFAHLLKNPHVSASQLRNLTDAFRLKGKAEARLFYDYTRSRMDDSNAKAALAALNSFARELGVSPPWHDAIAFRNQITDWGEEDA
jgi:RNase P subunit RPR2